jgi:hypothetical protein
MEGAKHAGPGIIHKNVDRSQFLPRLLNQGGDLIPARDVRLDGESLDSFATKTGRRSVELRLIPPANGYARAHLSQTAGDREPNSPARSRDERDLAC